MASMWRRAMVYLGLVDDEEYEEYDGMGDESMPPAYARRGAAPSGFEPEPVSGGVRTIPREPEPGVTLQARPAVVRPITPVQSARVHVVAPATFNDAQEIGDKLKVSQPVIVNLQSVDRDLARRIIDFSSGLAYGLGGQMDRVADQVFLLTPSNVEVSAEEKRRLQERGLYRA